MTLKTFVSFYLFNHQYTSGQSSEVFSQAATLNLIIPFLQQAILLIFLVKKLIDFYTEYPRTSFFFGNCSAKE